MATMDYEVILNENQIPSLDYYAQIDDDKVKEITKVHWVNNETHPNCFNKSCRKKFSLIDRVHHCRRCGRVFCKECTQYKRKLSYLATPDPEGKAYKVCGECFKEGQNSTCTTRSSTTEYRELRRRCKAQGHSHRASEVNNKSGITPSWRDKLDLTHECQRLLDGFKENVGSSEVKRTLQEMKTIVKTPEWQKATFWLQENMSEKCQKCLKSFGLIQKKVNCKLCAAALCKSCSKHELLVYMPDDGDQNCTTECQPELAIIRIIGSPDVEPEVSILLHVCESCRQYLVDKQILKAEQSLKAVADTSTTVLSKLISLDKTVSELQIKMTYQLSKYQEIVESLEDSSRASGDGSNTKILAKAQEDLSDFLAAFILKINVVKKLQSFPDTDTQKTLFRNYLMAMAQFYMESMHTFRSMKRKLADSAPPELLEYIQKIVDKHAIVSAQVYIRQLIFETIHLCEKHTLPNTIPSILMEVEKEIGPEIRTCLQGMNEDLDEHEQKVKEMVKLQINEHRLIRPSKRIIAKIGAKHVRDLILERTQELLEQISIQLAMKSINRSFLATKKALEAAKTDAQVTNMKVPCSSSSVENQWILL